MEKFFAPFHLFILIVLSSCTPESASFSTPKDPTAKVTVRTRTNTGESSHLFPAHVYTFDKSTGQCVYYQMLTEDSEDLFMSLPAGNYTIAALTGAPTDKYLTPEWMDATATSPLELTDPEDRHAELGAGQASITLEDNEHKYLTLTTSRVVAQIKFSVSSLPDNITDVKISLQPLKSILRIDGSFDETQSGEMTNIQLVKDDEENLWTTDSLFIFPGTANLTVGIVLTDDSGSDRSYAYNTPFAIKANYKYTIAATYKSGSPDISGVITGTDWAGEELCEFTFGNDPFRAGDFYKNCYILHIEKETDGQSTLYLLSPKQWVLNDTIGLEKLLNEYEYLEIKDWEVPTPNEARLLHELCVQDITGLNSLLEERGSSALKDDELYLCMLENGSIHSYRLAGTFSTQPVKKGDKYRARFLKKLQIRDL
jgi:hypothetical protein